ncbi:hypothetical protein M2152_000158 [Microbacteriaceae bacterium SG_E_30_P1]|uniref:DUF4190 domain-containing protein n=1 Tax=Antiquaquibacter oligotrophicus TaxID=2880260 RepID=A0ABT6KJ71_9MICO|nr:DUF4190 domain-containing protein [Antiquaquibacter oligotrophicus]MDH6179976.1 hypothetical protein [Antiquaquibacter oligotrophicus]UDF14267.1 DUF4190 domain-containing protein [Antiquaquibacter oligotrophicus]
MSTCPACSAPLQGDWKFCLSCGAPLPQAAPAAIRPDTADAGRTINLLAVIAFALGVIGGPIAAIFGHIAVRQIRTSGERGLVLARVAIVLGYVWLVVWIAAIAWIISFSVR